jgi:hypothetical protein
MRSVSTVRNMKLNLRIYVEARAESHHSEPMALRSQFMGSMATWNHIRSMPWIVAELTTLNRTNDTYIVHCTVSSGCSMEHFCTYVVLYNLRVHIVYW